jgi:hypothetical protein
MSCQIVTSTSLTQGVRAFHPYKGWRTRDRFESGSGSAVGARLWVFDRCNESGALESHVAGHVAGVVLDLVESDLFQTG